MWKYELVAVIQILFLCVVRSSFSTGPHNNLTCTAVVNDIFDNCTDKNPLSHQNMKNTFNERLARQSSRGVCKDTAVCRHNFTFSIYRKQLYSDGMKHAISDMLQKCCGACARLTLLQNITTIPDIYLAVTNKSDFVFPVLARVKDIEVHGYHFIPILDVPSAYLFTLRKSDQEIMLNLVKSCLKMWPLTTICFLMALISGFIAWIIETQGNPEEFPRDFAKGLFEGFWWSFVSMTTVGYGDKTMKSTPARMFAVVWILIGLTVCSLFTASLTTDIINVRTPTEPHMAGHLIGALEHQLQDATMIAQNGGSIRPVTYTDTILGVTELIKQLQRKTVEGFLINRSTYYYFFKKIRKKKYRKEWLKIQETLRSKVVRSEKFFLGEKLSYGMLIHHRHHYAYFQSYFVSNWLQLQACYAFTMNSQMNKIENNFFASHGGLFTPFLYFTVGTLLMIGCFGVVYEVRRRKKEQRAKNVNVLL